jgi:hypothetical protein
MQQVLCSGSTRVKPRRAKVNAHSSKFIILRPIDEPCQTAIQTRTKKKAGMDGGKVKNWTDGQIQGARQGTKYMRGGPNGAKWRC